MGYDGNRLDDRPQQQTAQNPFFPEDGTQATRGKQDATEHPACNVDLMFTLLLVITS